MRTADRLQPIIFWSLSGISLLGACALFGLTGLMGMASGQMTEPGNETFVYVLLALCLALSAWLFIGSIMAMSFYAAKRKKAAWLALLVPLTVAVLVPVASVAMLRN